MYGTAPVRFAQGDLVALVTADEVEILRQRGELRAGGGRLGHQPAGRLEVRRELRARHHLDRRDAREGHQFEICGVEGGGRIFSTFGSAQLPLTA